MFYLDKDKIEIRSWIKSSTAQIYNRIIEIETIIQDVQKSAEIPDAIKKFVQREINGQIFALSNEFQSQFDAIRASGEKLQTTFQAQIETLIAENSALRSELDELKRKPADVPDFQSEISALRSELAELKRKPADVPDFQSEISALKRELDELKRKPADVPDFQSEISALKRELDELKRKPADVPDFQSEISALRSELDELKRKLKLGGGDIEKFYLKADDEVFIPCDRKQIPAQITKALNVDAIKKFLVDHDSEISKKFQRLINTHCNAVKNLLNKLKLNELDDDELSETVTAKYFKLFHQMIFDNILVAVKRGLNDSDDFYRSFLPELNAYLEQCGFYTVNATSGRKAEDADYENMSPQIIETSDKSLDKVIKDIERLPYRINYLDEFGEKNFFQYNGVMILYKEV